MRLMVDVPLRICGWMGDAVDADECMNGVVSDLSIMGFLLENRIEINQFSK